MNTRKLVLEHQVHAVKPFPKTVINRTDFILLESAPKHIITLVRQYTHSNGPRGLVIQAPMQTIETIWEWLELESVRRNPDLVW